MNRWFFLVLAPVMLATLGLSDARRFRWALNWVAAAILVAYTLYVGSEAWQWWNGKPFGLVSREGQINLMNAIGGFIAFAVPSIVFLLTGKSGTEVDVLISDESPEAHDR